jgi:hypothetical protein
MAIRNPTQLSIDFNADIKTELANGRVTANRIITNNITVPFNSYGVGSVDIDASMEPMQLGIATTGVFTSEDPVEFLINNESSVITKLFAYDGPEVLISVLTTSEASITVEYALGVSTLAE